MSSAAGLLRRSPSMARTASAGRVGSDAIGPAHADVLDRFGVRVLQQRLDLLEIVERHGHLRPIDLPIVFVREFLQQGDGPGGVVGRDGHGDRAECLSRIGCWFSSGRRCRRPLR